MQMRFLIFAILIVFPILSFAQLSFYESSVKEYPEIQVLFNLRDPNGVDTNVVQFFENGNRLLEYRLVKKDSTKTAYKKKQVLVLIENSYWPRFDQQRKAIKNLWSAIVDSVFQSGDAFYLATFDWSRGQNILIFDDTVSFDSGSELNRAIQQIEAPRKDERVHESTEIYLALREAISFLNKQSRDPETAPVILLFSSEFNNIFNNSQTKSDVIVEARKSGIPIYAFRYAYSEKYDLSDIASATYGRHIDMRYTQNEIVVDLINEIPRIYGGSDYVLSFDSKINQFGDVRTLEIVLSNEDRFFFTFQAPSRFDLFWENTIFRYTSLFLFFVLVILTFWLIKQAQRRKALEKHEFLKKQEETNRKIQENETRAKNEKQIEIEKIGFEKQRTFNEKLNQSFRQLPRFPQLIAQNGDAFDINVPVFTIGRQEGNVLVIPNHTLSKSHAAIYFDHLPNKNELFQDRFFYLIDAGSTNGTLLNGRLIPAQSIDFEKSLVRLKNNDLIQMGEISFTFQA
jgi:hypothetical protein